MSLHGQRGDLRFLEIREEELLELDKFVDVAKDLLNVVNVNLLVLAGGFFQGRLVRVR